MTVAHEDIPGFMPAMTMPFVVLEKDEALLQAVGPGDEITATLVAPDSRYWLEDLVVVKRGTPDPNATPLARHEAHQGDAPPDVSLVDQDGRPLRLADYRGKAVALTFVFTRCPMPDFCPLMMTRFAAAHAALAKDEGLAAKTRLLTVSFDTTHDTPDVLRAYGAPFQRTKPPFTHWALATGKEDAVRRLRGGARARLRRGEPLLHPQPPHRGPRPRGEAPPALPRQRLDDGGARRRAEGGRRGLSAAQSGRNSRVRFRGPDSVTTTLSSIRTPPKGVSRSTSVPVEGRGVRPRPEGPRSIGMK